MEIQFRTLSMDFWASMEHRICYKREYDDKDKVSREMQQYAMALELIESRFEEQVRLTKERELEEHGSAE